MKEIYFLYQKKKLSLYIISVFDKMIYCIILFKWNRFVIHSALLLLQKLNICWQHSRLKHKQYLKLNQLQDKMAVAIWQLNFTLHYFKTILCACISRTSLQNNARILLEKVEEREGETLTKLLIKELRSKNKFGILEDVDIHTK